MTIGRMEVNHVVCPNCRTLHGQFFGLDKAIVCGCGTTITDIEVNEEMGYVKANVVPKGHELATLSYLYNHRLDDTKPPSVADDGFGEETPPF